MAERAVKKAPAKKAAKKAPAKKAAPRKRAPRKRLPPAEPVELRLDPVQAAPGTEIAVVDPHERARQAHEHLISGMSWDLIAAEFGYPSVQAATMDVRAYLQRVHVMTGDDERELAKRVELDRLDSLQRTFWPSAMLADKDAADIFLKISARRSKLLELETMSQRQGSQQTIVITSDNFADDLRALAEANDQRARAQDVVDADVVED